MICVVTLDYGVKFSYDFIELNLLDEFGIDCENLNPVYIMFPEHGNYSSVHPLDKVYDLQNKLTHLIKSRENIIIFTYSYDMYLAVRSLVLKHDLCGFFISVTELHDDGSCELNKKPIISSEKMDQFARSKLSYTTNFLKSIEEMGEDK